MGKINVCIVFSVQFSVIIIYLIFVYDVDGQNRPGNVGVVLTSAYRPREVFHLFSHFYDIFGLALNVLMTEKMHSRRPATAKPYYVYMRSKP